MSMKVEDVVITDEIRNAVSFTYSQCHARINAISSIQMEIFKQKYGRYPEVIEIWDFDKDIKECAEQVEEKLFKEYLQI